MPCVKCGPTVARPCIFLDTSALFAAVFSATGGARALLKLGELNAVTLYVGSRVLAEADEVFRRKAPDLLPRLAALLAQANVQVGPPADEASLATAAAVVGYAPDAQILAEALAATIGFFATHNEAHFLNNPRLGDLPCSVGSPGDAPAWVRSQIKTVS